MEGIEIINFLYKYLRSKLIIFSTWRGVETDDYLKYSRIFIRRDATRRRKLEFILIGIDLQLLRFFLADIRCVIDRVILGLLQTYSNALGFMINAAKS